MQNDNKTFRISKSFNFVGPFKEFVRNQNMGNKMVRAN